MGKLAIGAKRIAAQPAPALSPLPPRPQAGETAPKPLVYIVRGPLAQPVEPWTHNLLSCVDGAASPYIQSLTADQK
jgi:hypothetical protein